MPPQKEENPRLAVRRVIYEGAHDYMPKGELCIDDDIVCRAVQAKEAGFPEKCAFLQYLGLEIYTISPCYPERGKDLPAGREISWPELNKWTGDTDLFIFAVVDGPFEWGMRLLGLAEFFSLLRSPLAVKDLTEQVEKLYAYLLAKLAAEGVNGIILADDIAHQQGLFARPELLEKSFLTSYARQAEQALKAGLPVFYHSDGNYSAVLDSIVKAGFTGLQCLERAAGMDIKALREKLGEDICLWGHLDASDLEAAAEHERMQDLIAEIRLLARGRKFILGTTSGLFSGMNITVLKALYAAV